MKPGNKRSGGSRKPPGDKKSIQRKPTQAKRGEGTPDKRDGKSDFIQKGVRKSNAAKPLKPRAKRDPDVKRGGRRTDKKEWASDGNMRLNRFLSNAGICSRREADELIQTGLVEVNGKVVTEMGHKVGPTDTVKYNGSLVKREKLVYLLLNKPKGFITTTDDPKARKTVMELVAGACKERIYPVGRLDRATTGLLMFTNDGDMAKKLTHPSHGAVKIYQVTLNKTLSKADFAKLEDGITLEDGPVQIDEIAWVEGKAKNHIGVRIHIGRNRIVRRIFESLGYEVSKLDRVFFAGLTKKNLPRGKFRHLTTQEINNLKMIK